MNLLSLTKSIKSILTSHMHIEYLLLDQEIHKLILFFMPPGLFQIFLYLFQDIEYFGRLIFLFDFLT